MEKNMFDFIFDLLLKHNIQEKKSSQNNFGSKFIKKII